MNTGFPAIADLEAPSNCPPVNNNNRSMDNSGNYSPLVYINNNLGKR